MLKALGSRLTYANVMATGAMFVALGGGAYALSGIPDRGGVFHGCVSNATGVLRVVKSSSSCAKPKTIRRHGKRVHLPGELAVSWNQQGPRGFQGVQGVQGQQGIQGQQGDTGPSDSFAAFLSSGSASLNLPTGRYVFNAAIGFTNAGGSPATDQCSWMFGTGGPGQTNNGFHATSPGTTVPANGGSASTANAGDVDVSGPGTFPLGISCPGGIGRLTATRVATLH